MHDALHCTVYVTAFLSVRLSVTFDESLIRQSMSNYFTTFQSYTRPILWLTLANGNFSESLSWKYITFYYGANFNNTALAGTTVKVQN